MATEGKPSYTLRYFDFIGIVETCRLLLTAGKVNWTEEHPEWPEEKEKQPLGRLPVLIEKRVDGSELVLSESQTIERFLARTFGFLPMDPGQSAIQEQLRDQQSDVFYSFFYMTFVHSDEDKKLGREKFNDLFTRIVNIYADILKTNSCKNHLFGDKLSYADMSLYGFLKLLGMHSLRFRDDACELVKAKMTPEILHLLSSVEADPLLEAHLGKCDSLVSALSE
ncbi:hypothetical protein H4R24_001392 [Coemansia sp. RSA 988]|nr:hypothetical protein H4R24_001392 [Coemansia sp. RSA 988]